MQPRFVALLLGALLGPYAGAQVSRFEGKRIVDIQYSQPGVLDPADLERAQPLRKGEPLREEDVAHAIDGLFATGRYKDIRIEAEAAGTDGVVVRFVTEPQYFVGGVQVEGKMKQPPNRAETVSNAQI